MTHTLYAMPVRWKLKELLDREGLNVNRLSLEMAGEKGPEAKRPQLYAITSPNAEKRPKRVEFAYLDEVLQAMKRITGKSYQLGDLLEYVEGQE